MNPIQAAEQHDILIRTVRNNFDHDGVLTRTQTRWLIEAAEQMYAGLARLREPLEGVTEGEWAVDYLDQHGQRVARSEHTEICTCWHHCVGSLEKQMEANARFIAFARTGVPELVEEVKRLREALTKATTEFEANEDMAAVGESLMEAIADNIESGPLRGWAPADGPAEVVVDLLNMIYDRDEALKAANQLLCRAHDRIHALPRTSDSALATAIRQFRADNKVLINPEYEARALLPEVTP